MASVEKEFDPYYQRGATTPEQLFQGVLEKDEKIIKMYKPDKKKFNWYVRLLIWLSTVWFYGAVFVVLDPAVRDWFGGWLTDNPWLIVLAIIGAVTLLIILIELFVRIFTGLYYKNRYYVYTDRRVLVRSGVFGIDYKSLEYRNLTATIVKVSLLDRLIKHKTGTIVFGSPSSPVTGALGAMALNPYRFGHIVDPYVTLTAIKEVIAQCESRRGEAKTTTKKK